MDRPGILPADLVVVLETHVAIAHHDLNLCLGIYRVVHTIRNLLACNPETLHVLDIHT